MSKAIKNQLDLFEKLDFSKKISNDNFFSIGTRGFYENPFTEILSYILNQKTEYNYRNEFIRILFENHLENEVIESIISRSNINTQFCTNNRNRIDLIIYNDKYILVFENKIHHYLSNPLDDYEMDIQIKYPSLKKIFFIFSYNSTNSRKNWQNINIRESFDKLRKKIKHKFDNKWDYFVSDFLVQFSDRNRIDMEKTEFEFYEKNFHKIILANENLNNFIINIGEELKKNCSLISYRIINNWAQFNRAIRYYPFNNENNVTLIFMENGQFSVSVYYYKDFKEFHQSLQNYIGFTDYEIWNEGNIFCSTRLPGKELETLEEALKECQLQLEKMKKYFL